MPKAPRCCKINSFWLGPAALADQRMQHRMHGARLLSFLHDCHLAKMKSTAGQFCSPKPAGLQIASKGAYFLPEVLGRATQQGRTCETPEGSTRYSCGPSRSYTASSVAVPNGLQSFTMNPPISIEYAMIYLVQVAKIRPDNSTKMYINEMCQS